MSQVVKGVNNYTDTSGVRNDIEDYSVVYRQLFNNEGVLSGLVITPTDPVSSSIQISAGYCVIDCGSKSFLVFRLKTNTTLVVPNTGSPKNYLVCLKVDLTNATNEFVVVEGTSGLDPSLTEGGSPEVYYLVIGRIVNTTGSDILLGEITADGVTTTNNGDSEIIRRSARINLPATVIEAPSGDADLIQIDYVPTSYTRTIVSPATVVTQLLSHLKGIDNKFAATDISIGTQGLEHTRKQLLINGNTSVWQLNTSFTGVSNNQKTADGYRVSTNGTAGVDVTRQAGTGLSEYCIRVARSSNNSYWGIYQRVEKKKVIPLRGKVLCFSVETRKGSAFTAGLKLSVGVTTNADDFTSYSTFLYGSSIPDSSLSTTTFQRFSMSFTVPVNATNLQFEIDTDAAQAGGANVYFEVQQFLVNEGTTPVEFSPKSPEQYEQECMRYIEKSYDIDTVVGTATMAGAESKKFDAATSYACFPIRYRVTKRVTPSLIAYSPSTSTVDKIRNLTNGTDLTAGYGFNSNAGTQGNTIFTAGVAVAAGHDLAVQWCAQDTVF